VKLLLVGPLPPPLGGTTVSFAQLVRDLEARGDVAVTVLPTAAEPHASRIRKIAHAARQLVRILVAGHRHDVISFHASVGRMVFFGPFVLAVSRLVRRPLVLRVFGGALDWAHGAGGWKARPFLHLLLRADLVLLQTRAGVAFFRERYPRAKIEWFPNSRKREIFDRRSANGVTRFAFVGLVRPSKGIGEIVRASKLLGDRPFLAIMGRSDQMCPVSHAEARQALFDGKTNDQVFFDAGHRLGVDYVPHAVAWINKHL